MFEEYTSLTAEEAAHYCEGTESQPVRAEIRRRVLPDEFVLEIGCGNGIDAGRYPPDRYEGIDVSPALIAEAQARHPGHKFRCLDVLENEFVCREVVFAKSVLEHAPDTDTAVAMLREMLRIATRVVFVAWHTPPDADGPEQLRRVMGHFGKTIHQNRYRLAPFAAAICGRPWFVSRHGPHHLWEIQC